MKPTSIFIPIAVIGIIGASYFYWSPDSDLKKVLLQDGREFSEKQIEYLLAQFNRQGVKDVETQGNKLLIPSCHRTTCNQIVHSKDFVKIGLNKKEESSSFPNPFMSPSEKARLAKKRKLQRIQDILERIQGIRAAEIIQDEVKTGQFSRSLTQTAMVTLWADESDFIDNAKARTARAMVSKAFAGMKEDQIAVFDGDTGTTFEISRSSGGSSGMTTQLEAQADLAFAQRVLEQQTQVFLKRFGNPTVSLRMELAEQKYKPAAQISDSDSSHSSRDVAEALPNGTGSIAEPNPIPAASTKGPHSIKTKTVKRILGMDISIAPETVRDFVQGQIGPTEEISEEQFARGLMGLRNEITKELVLWLRSNKGIDLASELVTVTVLQDSIQQSETGDMHVSSSINWTQKIVIPVIAGLGLLIITVLMLMGKRKSSPTSQANNPRRVSSASPISQRGSGNQFEPESPGTPLDSNFQGNRSGQSLASSEF